jgi:hypothetical protein
MRPPCVCFSCFSCSGSLFASFAVDMWGLLDAAKASLNTAVASATDAADKVAPCSTAMGPSAAPLTVPPRVLCLQLRKEADAAATKLESAATAGASQESDAQYGLPWETNNEVGSTGVWRLRPVTACL